MKQLSYLLATMLICSACSLFEDDDEPSLTLSLSYDTNINPGQLVTVTITDPSLENFDFNFYSTFLPSSARVFDSEGNELSTFSGSYPENSEFSFYVSEEGSYEFEFSAAAEGYISTVSISASGCRHLDESSFLALSNIEKRVLDGIDYCITEEINIPNGTSIRIGEDVQIQMGTEAGFIVNGSLFMSSATLYPIEETGWKGFLINNGGTMGIYNSNITEAGYTAFTDQPKAMIVNNGTLSMDGSFLSTSAPDAFGVYFLDNIITSDASTNTSSITAQHPVYAELDDFLSLNAHLSGSGFSTIIGAGELTSVAGFQSNIFFGSSAKLHISGSIQFGKPVNLQSNDITMEEGQSLIFSGGLASSSTTIKGKDGVSWKGIYLSGSNNNFNGMTVENAGSDFINISGNPLDVKAAVYVAGFLTSVNDCSINNSEGYGLYISNFATSFQSISSSDNSFDSNTMADISGPLDFIAKLLNISNNSNSFSFTNSAAESIEIRRQTSASITSSGYVLSSLGTDNYYLLNDNLTFNLFEHRLELKEGVHIKVAAGKGIQFTNSGHGGILTSGTTTNPVVIEADDATAGWNGIFFQGTRSSPIFDMEYTTISGGGASQFAGASNSANLIFDSSTVEFLMTNCSVNDSKGYGVLIEIDSNLIDFDNTELDNSFTGNTSGDVLNQNI